MILRIPDHPPLNPLPSREGKVFLFISTHQGETLHYQAVEKHPSVALRLSLVIAAYRKVRLIPHDVAPLASECF